MQFQSRLSFGVIWAILFQMKQPAETERIDELTAVMQKMRNIAVLTGSGISAESGIPTFRGKDGLWKQYRAEQLATPSAFEQDPELVWQWYDWRRGIIGSKKPNAGHEILVRWENRFPSFSLITQNIDGFHQKAGSKEVIELHGNIWKLRCTQEQTVSDVFDVPLKTIPPLCPTCGSLLRPHVVWFGESLDGNIIQQAFQLSRSCEMMFVIGTSAVVQPAASLPLGAADSGAKVVEINPDPTPLTPYADFSFKGKAGEVLPMIDDKLRSTSADGKEDS